MFGLIPLNNNEKFYLKSVKIECNVSNLSVMCTSEFSYKNETDQNMDAIFSFPLEGNYTVYHFEAIVGGTTIKGICKDSEESKNMFTTVTMREKSLKSNERIRRITDMFKCPIGNIKGDSEIRIIIKFAMELKLISLKSDFDQFNLCLPLLMKPRFTPPGAVAVSEVYEVSKEYQYNLRVIINGSIKIKNIFSKNQQLNVTIYEEKRMNGLVILESKFDGSNDLDIFIDYMKINVSSVLYEYGTSSRKFTGNKPNKSFYKNDVVMLNFLPEFEKKNYLQNKMEFVFFLDRSGSMQGERFKYSKECLLIFLKSLPLNCKFQIYGFGETYEKVFPAPQLYEERFVEEAMDKLRSIRADLGGTDLLGPLKDLYNCPLTNGFIRVVFVITDGDIDNHDQIFKLVKKHNQWTKLFTVGIGDEVSKYLVDKLAEFGGGKSKFSEKCNTLTANVIKHLEIALDCDIFTDCKIEWKCPKNASVIMVPSNPGPLFSNYFLTVFCIINDLEDDDYIECLLSGNANGKPLRLSFNINGKEGTSDDDFRVHRMLAKYKIDEMTTQIEDGQNDLKKSLIDLSLEVNMVTNYTKFVAIDQDAPEKGLILNENTKLQFKNSMQLFKSSTNSGGLQLSKSSTNSGGLKDMLRRKSTPSISDSKPSPRQRVVNDLVDNDNSENCKNDVVFLAEKQNIAGFWNMNEDILKELGMDSLKVNKYKPISVSNEIWMTAIIYQYFVVELIAEKKEWTLLVGKAEQWLRNSIKDLVNMNKILEEAAKMIPSSKFINIVDKVTESTAEMPAMVSKPINNFNETNADIVRKNLMMPYLTGKQYHDGSWGYETEIIDKIGSDTDTIQNNKPDEMSIDTWTTLLVQNFITTKLKNKEMEWFLVVGKAKKFICTKVKESVALKVINSEQVSDEIEGIDEILEACMEKALEVLQEKMTKECLISATKIEEAILKEKKLQLYFVVDRSGSMDGDKIVNAIQSLLTFLTAIPLGCIFQVYGFGTNFDKAFTQSQLYTQDTLNKAKTYANNMKADFGSTDIFKPLNEIYKCSIIKEFSKVIFIITDGCVDNENKVVELVRNNNKTTKVYLVGLGEDVSVSLVKLIAEASFGKFIILRDSKNLILNVNQLFKIALN